MSAHPSEGRTIAAPRRGIALRLGGGQPLRVGGKKGTTVLLGAITALAVGLRFGTLATQSLWADEGYTARIASSGLGSAASQIPHTESTPPLYYATIWLWAHIFGDSAVGLRSLSALYGCLTVLAMFFFTNRLAGRRAASIAATLTATNPLMVWYSQEARAYALFVLLCVCSLGCFLLALRDPCPRWVLGWALATAAALATHYFAVFPAVAEGVWLLQANARRRIVLKAVTIPLAMCAALAPLLLYQRSHVPRPWTQLYTVGDQVKATGQSFFIGPTWNPTIHRAGLAVLVFLSLAALYAVVRQATRTERRLAAELGGLAAASLLLALAISASGPDYLAPRNLLYAWPMLAIVVALGAGRRTAGWRSVVLTGIGCALSIWIVIAVASDQDLQRDNWRGLLSSLGQTSSPRVVLVLDGFTDGPVVEYYLPHLRRPPERMAVSEIDVVGTPQEILSVEHSPPVPSTPASVELGRHIGLVRFIAPHPITVSVGRLAPAESGARAFVQEPS